MGTRDAPTDSVCLHAPYHSSYVERFVCVGPAKFIDDHCLISNRGYVYRRIDAMGMGIFSAHREQGLPFKFIMGNLETRSRKQ